VTSFLGSDNCTIPSPLLNTIVIMAFPLIKSLITILLLIAAISFLRLISILPPFRSRPKPRRRGEPAHLLIVLGSGGHTAEMLAMLRNALTGRPDAEGKATSQALDWTTFTHRTWIVSSGDTFSATRAKEFEDEAFRIALGANTHRAAEATSYTITSVPRARKIHQPLLTTPLSSLKCLYVCLRLLMSHEHGCPDLILTNGPATATILVWASVILRFFGFGSQMGRGQMRTIYVESWARVKKLSLSGRLLCWVVDRVLVQWPQLKGTQGRGEYLGVLV